VSRNVVRFIRFRVYAGEREGSGLYVVVRIFKTQRELLTALRAERPSKRDRYPNHTEGACQSFKVYPQGRRRPNGHFATVNLWRGRLGMEVVAHEFGHAAFAWAWRKRLVDKLAGMPAEEEVCYTLGRMLRRFVARAYQLGLYTEA
jgi:hypothetical protein